MGPIGAAGPAGPAGASPFTVAQASALQAFAPIAPYFSAAPNPFGVDICLTGANFCIRSGSGATDGPVNGLGNLIVGYQELRGDGSNNRTGSHNIVVGFNNNYSGFRGMVIGETERDRRR